MADAFSATARAAVGNPASKVSVAQGGVISASLRGSPNLTDGWMAIGPVAAGPPATYADFESDLGSDLATLPGNQTVTYHAGDGTYDVSLSITLDASAVALGDPLYVAWFGSGGHPPSGGSVPEFVSGPFTVVA